MPHVRFLTTGITAAEAKRAVESKEAASAEGRVGGEKGGGDGRVKSAMKAVVKVRVGGKGEDEEGEGKGGGE